MTDAQKQPTTKTVYCIEYFSVLEGKHLVKEFDSLDDLTDEGWDEDEHFTKEVPVE